MDIKYICAWDKIKEKTWSGTTYSLYSSLKKKNKVEDINLSLTRIEKIKMIISRLNTIKIKSNKVKINYQFSPLRRNIYRKKMKNVDIKDDDITLQIGDYIICKNPNYIYQDLSIDSLIYFKENHYDLFKYSSFEDYTEKDLIYRRNEQLKFYEHTQGIFTMSKWLAKNLIEYSNIPEEKVYHVGAGVNIDIKKIDNNIKKEKNKILFVGRDFFRKGGDLTYNAFKILKEKYDLDAELYIAGPKEWPMEDMIEGVKFLGDLPVDELNHYFNICDIFCMPSRFEAYGLVFIEALVYGLPCIGRNEFEMKEFINDGYNGYLINDENIEILADKMYSLLKNDQIKENVLINREKYIQEYSWDTVAEKIIKVIKDHNQ